MRTIVFFLLLNFAVPSAVVLPGPLKSNGSPALLATFAMTGLAGSSFLVLRRRPTGSTASTGGLLLGLYAAAQLIEYANSQTNVLDSSTEASTTRALISAFSSIGLAVFLIKSNAKLPERRLMLCVLVGTVTYSGVIGLSQEVSPTLLRHLLTPPGLVMNQARLLPVRAGLTRVNGTVDDPIELGVLMASCLPISLYLRRTAATKLARTAWLLCALVMLATIPATVSRSALVALAVTTAVYAFSLNVRKIANGLVGLAILVACLYTINPGLTTTLVNLFTQAGSDNSISSRTDAYSVVAQIFRAHPFLGTGLGTDPPAVLRYLDNQWLQQIVQGGLLGVASLALFVAGLYRGGLLALQRCWPWSAPAVPDQSLQALSLLACASGILSSSFTFDLFAFPQLTLLLFFIYGTLWSEQAHEEFKTEGQVVKVAAS